MPLRSPTIRSIAIDVGNTRVKCSDGVHTLALESGVPMKRLQREILDFCGPRDAAVICISGVNRKVLKSVGKIFSSYRTLPIARLLASSASPLRSVRSEGTGVDRILGAIGAMVSLKGFTAMDPLHSPVITVDCGTATTINLVNARKEFSGGVILPGIETQLQSLYTATSALPRVSKDGPTPLIARNTENAIRSGVVVGTVGAIVYTVKQMRNTAEGAEARIVLCGGNAEVIKKLLKKELEFRHMDDCVLRGVLYLMERYNKDVYGSDSPSWRSGRSTARKHIDTTRART